MTREWKPGEVAWWEGQRIFREGYNENNAGSRWMSAENGECWPEQYASADDDPRPLVVIDPEDREQVERLMGLLKSQDRAPEAADIMQAALREFADPKPPRPDEPLGLGTVVEDESGCLWVKFTSKTGDWWRNHIGENRRYADIAVVRVLSEGVTQ